MLEGRAGNRHRHKLPPALGQQEAATRSAMSATQSALKRGCTAECAQDIMLTPEPAVSAMAQQLPQSVRRPSVPEGRLSQPSGYFSSPLVGATLLACAMRRASLEDLVDSPHIRQVRLQRPPSAPRAPAVLQVDSALSMAMSETYLSEIQSDHSIHQQLSALAEAYLQHTAGRASEDSVSVGILSRDLDPEAEPELPAQDPIDISLKLEGIGKCPARGHPPAAANEVAWKLSLHPADISGHGILAHRGEQRAWPGQRGFEYADAAIYQERNGDFSKGSKQRLQLRASRRTDALGKRRFTTTAQVRTPVSNCCILHVLRLLNSIQNLDIHSASTKYWYVATYNTTTVHCKATKVAGPSVSACVVRYVLRTCARREKPLLGSQIR